jgi:diguanylate cyclase (GGDEF)-like protein/PAS domain S-box-containing protein
LTTSASLYAGLLLLSGLIACFVAFLSWQHRKSAGGIYLMVMMIAMIVWNWTYALHWLSPKWPLPYFWLDATYLGVVAAPMLLLLFTLHIVSPAYRVSRPLIFCLLIEPLLTLVLLWTDPLHHLFFGSARLADASDIFSGGPWFWINVVYSYALLILVFILLVAAFQNRRGQIYQRQISICLAGIAILFIVNLVELFGFHPLPGLDLTPILFIITGSFFSVSLISFQMLDLVPVARDVLMDQIQNGVMVVDSLGRIVDINRPAALFFEKSGHELIGKRLADIASAHPELAKAFLPLEKTNRQIKLSTGDVRNLEIEITPLVSSSMKENGYVISLRDITQLKQAETALVQSRDYYLTLFDEFPALIWRSGTDAKCNYFNKTWLSFTGRAMEQEIGDGWAEGVHPDDFKACVDTYLECFAAHRPFQMEYRLRRYDGEYRWLTDFGRPFYGLDGEFAGYIGSCYDISDRKRDEAFIREMAYHDSLTGVYNRKGLQEEMKKWLAHAQRSSKKLAVFFLDVDQFKAINDRYGHKIGDAVLVGVALRLTTVVRVEDIVARIGGDEFVLLSIVNDLRDAKTIEERISRVFKSPMAYGDDLITIRVSVGTSIFPDDGDNEETLLHLADTKMYQMKQAARQS